MGCEVSIQVHPMPPPDPPEPTAEAEPIKDSRVKTEESTKLTRQDSLSSTVTIMLDESDFQQWNRSDMPNG